jgi:hypothetical protein
MKKYPDTPLKKQVRNYNQTQSAFDVIFVAFFATPESSE